MTETPMFRGVDLGWMQAQWRDCADKPEQLRIFRDMTGATIQEILDAIGDPGYCGPIGGKRGYKRFSAEDDATILRMIADGATNKEIGDAIGRTDTVVGFRITSLRKRGVEIPARPHSFKKKAETLPEPQAAAVPERTEPAKTFPALDGVGEELRRMIAERDELRVRLASIEEDIEKYKAGLAELLSAAGGWLV